MCLCVCVCVCVRLVGENVDEFDFQNVGFEEVMDIKWKFSWIRSCFLWRSKESGFLRWKLLLVKML